MDAFVCFWRPDKKNGFLGNWFPSRFVDADGKSFLFGEQYIMWRKAVLFNDTRTAKAIRNARDPGTCKDLGRQVSDFQQAVWDANIVEIAQTTCYLKFSQNPELKKALLDTGDAYICEASPRDAIWGIGLECIPSNYEAIKAKRWSGQNILGEALMHTRELLRKQVS